MTDRYIARVNEKTGDFEVYDTQSGQSLDPRACAEKLNEKEAPRDGE